MATSTIELGHFLLTLIRTSSETSQVYVRCFGAPKDLWLSILARVIRGFHCGSIEIIHTGTAPDGIALWVTMKNSIGQPFMHCFPRWLDL